MARVVTIDGVDVSSRIEMGTLTELTTAARGGERGGGRVTITDPLGTLNLRGWHTITIDEDLDVARPRLFTGRIGGKEIQRGPEGPIGIGRVWDCDLEDVNALAHMRPVWGNSAKRGQELGLTRVAWLLSTLAVGGSFVDTGYVNDAFDRLFDEADYRGNYPDETLDDITGVRGRDWFIFWDYVALEVALFYNYRDSAILNSTFRVSNVEGDADFSTTWPTGSAANSDDSSISRQHDEVYAGVLFRTAAGDFYVERSSTIATFFHETPIRVAVVENSRIGRRETALAMAEDFLDAHAIERDTLTIPVRLPASHVNDVAAGERIQVKLEHQPGYESGYVWIRVARKTVSEAGLGANNEPMYDVVLVCTNSAPANASGSGAPSPGEFPTPPPQPESNWYAGTLTTSTENNGVAASANVGGSVPATVWSPDGTTSSTNTDIITLVNGVTYHYVVDFIVDVMDEPTGTKEWGIGSASAPATWSPLHISEPGGVGAPLHWEGDFTPLMGDIVGCLVATQPGESHGVRPFTVIWTIDPAGWDPGGGATAPLPGQWISGWELVTMTGDSGTTAWPFADGSLMVRVDIMEQLTEVIASYDGTTGAFTLTFDPDESRGQQVFVRYQGR